MLKKRIRESLQAWQDPNEIEGIDALPRLIELGHSHGSFSVKDGATRQVIELVFASKILRLHVFQVRWNAITNDRLHGFDFRL